MADYKLVALLPMKANSERIPGKNFRSFAGKPLFRWILDTLLAINEIDLVVINTDARDILAENGLVEGERVRIRERKPELCGDFVSMNLILGDDIGAIGAETYLMTHNTNPLLSAKTVSNAIAAFRSSECDSLFSVNRIQTRFYTADAKAINHDPANLIRTQDLEPWFEENSCLYLFSATSFGKTKARIGEDPQIFEIPKTEAIDLDEPEDWAMAEALALYERTEQ